MEIVIAHPFDPMNLREGGSIRYASLLVEELLTKGHRVTLFGVQLGKHRCYKPGLNFIPVTSGSDGMFRFTFSLMSKLPFLAIPERAIIHAFRIDFLFPFVFWKPGHVKVLTSDKPDEWMRRQHPFVYRFGGRLVRQRIESFVMKRVNYLITDKRTLNYYLGRYPWLANKHLTQGTGVNLDKFKPLDKKSVRRTYEVAQDDRVVLFLGRLARIKNIELLMDSFKIIEDRIPNALLMIAGRGDPAYEAVLKQHARGLGLQRVRYTGEIHPDKVPEIINCADVVALTSHIEGSPNVVKESIACGVPVVATNVGDISEHLHNERLGRVVDRHPFAIAESLAYYLNGSSDQRREIVEECMKHRESYSIKNVVEKILEVYETLYESSSRLAQTYHRA